MNEKLYIGISKNFKKRINSYMRDYLSNDKKVYSKQNILKAFRKYGIDKFSIDIIGVYASIEECKQCEIFWISYLRSMNIEIYNISDGGDFVVPNSRKGFEVSTSKFKNEQEIINVFNMYHNEYFTAQEIADKLNTTDTLILRILNAQTYKKITKKLILNYPEPRKFNFYSGKHNRRAGLKHHNSKLNEQDIKNMFELYHNKFLSTEQIGKLYNMSRGSVYKILVGKSYKLLTIEFIKQYPTLRSSTFHLHGK